MCFDWYLRVCIGGGLLFLDGGEFELNRKKASGIHIRVYKGRGALYIHLKQRLIYLVAMCNIGVKEI